MSSPIDLKLSQANFGETRLLSGESARVPFGAASLQKQDYFKNQRELFVKK